MAGRAGRRGMDTEGFVLYAPTLSVAGERNRVPVHELKTMLTGAESDGERDRERRRERERERERGARYTPLRETIHTGALPAAESQLIIDRSFVLRHLGKGFGAEVLNSTLLADQLERQSAAIREKVGEE